MLKTREEIQDWLDKMGIEKTTIRSNLTVDVILNVNLSYKRLTEIPIQFGTVGGYFDCSYNELTSLKGSPQSVVGSFIACNNQLVSLEHLPLQIIGDITLSDNKLKTIKGLPSLVKNSLLIENNQIESWKDLPKRIKGDLNIKGNITQDFNYKEIIIDGHITMSFPLETDMLELDKYCYVISHGKGSDRTNELIFSGPFEEYKYVMEKRELLENLNKDLPIQQKQANRKI